MNFEYEWNKEDFKKELTRKRLVPNIAFLLFGIIIYAYIMSFGIKSKMFDNKIILIISLIFIAILVLILFVSTKLFVFISLKKNEKNNPYGVYKVNLNKDSIIVEVNNNVIQYKYSEIIKYKKRKNYLFVRTKEDKIGLIFKRNVIKNNNYNELIKYIESVR